MVAGNRHSGSVKVAPFRSALREYGRIKVCCKSCKAKVYVNVFFKGQYFLLKYQSGQMDRTCNAARNVS